MEGEKKEPLVVPGFPVQRQLHQPPPPPPTENDASHQLAALPPGWSVAVSPNDGRMYYWEMGSGRTSWTHPSMMSTAGSLRSVAPPQPPSSTGAASTTTRGISADKNLTRAEYHDTPWNASRRPENHQCRAVVAFVLCFPMGILALWNSYSVDTSWGEGRYGDAVNHSRQAQRYSSFGIFVGVVFWIYWLFFHEPRIIDWQWPDFNWFD